MKDRIYLHRAYKRLPGVTRRQLTGMVLVILACEVVLVLAHVPLTEGVVAVAAALLERCGIPTVTMQAPFLPALIETMPVLNAVYSFPNKEFALVCLLLATLAVVIVPSLPRLPKALGIYTTFVAMLTIASGAFFVFVPERFPYDMSEFSRLYMGTELGIWLMLPLVTGLALAPLPAPLAQKALVILVTVAYSLLFGAIRYAAFVLILRVGTVFFMAGLFFALGPFVDFVYVVAIYALYLNRVSVRIQEGEGTWRWSS